MTDIVRDSAFGQIIRLATGNKYFLYEEEKAGFKVPLYEQWVKKSEKEEESATPGTTNPSRSRTDVAVDSAAETATDTPNTGTVLTHTTHVPSPVDIEEALSRVDGDDEGVGSAMVPKRTDNGTIIVDWYTADDPENPQNWSSAKKLVVALEISLYTFTVYIGSSIYTPAAEDVMRIFGVGPIAASQGLALYVLAYGIGPMLFSPLSEIPAIGRNVVYIPTLALFVILWVPLGLVSNYPGLLVLRFLAGFFGSPCLATGAASYADMYSIFKLPYLLALWASGATFGPALGPVLGGFSIAAENWHWNAWIMLWLSGPMFITMFFFYPETSSANILLRRAKRLRKLTGNLNLQSQSEIDQRHMTAGAVTYEALVEPWKINILDPAVLYTTIYTALVYAIYYSFFESVPLVYPVIYGFNLGQTGLTFLAIIVGLVLMAAFYCTFYYYVSEPRIRKLGLGMPEQRLLPAMYTGASVPIALFLYAWTTRKSVHWIASVIGIGLDVGGTFIVMQCMFMYMAFTYPNHSASLFAANDFARSSLSFAAILFSRPMFVNIGVPAGCSLLGGLTILCTLALYPLYYWGPNLRARSKFAVK